MDIETVQDKDNLSAKEDLHRYSITLMPSSQHPWVHVDVKVTRNRHPFISLSDFMSDPVLKLFADDTKDDIAEPSLWNFLQLLQGWKVHHDLWHGQGLLGDKYRLQGIILRNPQGLHVVVVDEVFGPRNEVTHEVLKRNKAVINGVAKQLFVLTYDRDGFIGRKISFHIDSEEIVYLSLTLEFACEGSTCQSSVLLRVLLLLAHWYLVVHRNEIGLNKRNIEN